MIFSTRNLFSSIEIYDLYAYNRIGKKIKKVAPLSFGWRRGIVGTATPLIANRNKPQQSQSKQPSQPTKRQQQQQLHSSNKRQSTTKLRPIQSQPNTFIIDLQQQ
uniref:Uncharacterized protein n=1 Tax=Ceratitis capitata TaxID=7213 RepID=W8ATZ9_CERCA